MRAVIFDLWETLVPLPPSLRAEALLATAHALRQDGTAFGAHWAAGRVQRELQPLTTFLQSLRAEHGYDWTDQEAAAAIRARGRHFRRAFDRVPDSTWDVVTELRRRGHRVGLISNCSSDVRETLEETGVASHFDTITLSCEVGRMKPDPRLFSDTLMQLGGGEGWYIGDDNDDELAGARSAGLIDVLLDTGRGRTGTHRIRQLTELLTLTTEKTCGI